MKDLNSLITSIRGENVILDSSLAILYGVETKALKQAVKRNLNRFPKDFMFTLTRQELSAVRSQIVTSSLKTLNRARPMAFTESGIAMLSSVLKSKKAIEINIMIMRVFILIRKTLISGNDISLKIGAIESELAKHSTPFEIIFQLLEKLNNEDIGSSKPIGFEFN